jgi:hypothetical protein
MTKKSLLFIILLALAATRFADAQVTIGALTTPKATLEVVAAPNSSTADGIIAPRVSLKNLNDNKDKYDDAQKGALVYVENLNDTPSGKTANIKSTGYYFFDGDLWNTIGAIEPWNASGSTDPAKLNTQDIYTQGNVGIGTTTPTTKIDINAGNAAGTGFKLQDGNQSAGRVLTCDANGNATWDYHRMHVIKGTTNADNVEYTIPSINVYAEIDGIKYLQSTAAVHVSKNNYITLPPGVWKVEFSFPMLVISDFANAEADWLEGLVFFTSNPDATSYNDKYTNTDGVAVPHLVQCQPAYIERGFGWSFIKNTGNTPVTLYMAFGRLNLNYRKDSNTIKNNWFGKKLMLLPTYRTPYLYATEVGSDFLF